MKEMGLTGTLIEFGLSENEARVYLASLSVGPSTILAISKQAELKRTTVYSVIERLKQNGLMSIEIKGFKKRFTAENPSKLEKLLELRREKFRETLPELNALYRLKGGQSFIKYYEGVSGVKSVYSDILKELHTGNEYLVISDQEQFINLDREYFEHHIEERAKLNLSARALFQGSPTAQHYKDIEGRTRLHVRFLPKGTKLTANLVIMEKKVIITQLVPPIMAIVIENRSIVTMHHEQFEIIWKSVGEKMSKE